MNKQKFEKEARKFMLSFKNYKTNLSQTEIWHSGFCAGIIFSEGYIKNYKEKNGKTK